MERVDDVLICIRAPRVRNSDAKGASNCGAFEFTSEVSEANRLSQMTDPISWNTCQKQATTPIKNTKNIKLLSCGLASNTGNTCGSATNAPNVVKPITVNISTIWRTGCVKCGCASLSACAMRHAPGFVSALAYNLDKIHLKSQGIMQPTRGPVL